MQEQIILMTGLVVNGVAGALVGETLHLLLDILALLLGVLHLPALLPRHGPAHLLLAGLKQADYYKTFHNSRQLYLALLLRHSA